MKGPHKTKRKPAKQARKAPHKASRGVKPPRRAAKGPSKVSKRPPKKDRRLEGISERSDLIGIEVTTQDDNGDHTGKVISVLPGLVVIQRDDNPAPSRRDHVQLDRFEEEHPGVIDMRCGTWRVRRTG